MAISQKGVQTLEIRGIVEPHWVAANRKVRADAGKLALVFGPYVYCLEEMDNGPELPFVTVSPDAKIGRGGAVSNLPGDLPSLHFTGMRLSSGVEEALYALPAFSFERQEFTAVPYALWCNRTPGEMLVWLRAQV